MRICSESAPAASMSLHISLFSSTVVKRAESPMALSFSSTPLMSTWTGKSAPHSALMPRTISQTKRVRLSKVCGP